MNKSRRARLDKILEQIDDIICDINTVREEEEEAYENLPESIQDSDRGQAMTDAIDNLEEAINNLEDIEDYLNEAKGD